MAYRHNISNMVRWWLLLLQLCWAPSGALGRTAISTECPDTFNNKTANSIWCYIDPVVVSNTSCLSVPTEVSLTFFNSEGGQKTLCSTSYVTCTNSTNCGCLSSLGSIKVYWFSLTDNEGKYSGGNFSCTVDCGFSLTTNNSKGCEKVTFNRPNILSKEAIIGLTVGLTALSTALILIIIFIKCMNGKKEVMQCPVCLKDRKLKRQNSTANSGDNKNKVDEES